MMVYSKSEGQMITSSGLNGYALAAYVLCNLAEQPFNSYIIEDVKQGLYLRNYHQLKRNWMKSDVELDIDDMEFLARVYD
jgi:hypothetical protein